MSDPDEIPAPAPGALAALQSERDALAQQLADTHRQLDLAERRRGMDQLLIESEAIDLEAARLLTEAAVESMSDPDVALAIADLRRRKPYLFRRASAPGMGGSSGGAMSARPRPRSASVNSDEAATVAAATGHRADLLAYLRLRRRKSTTPIPGASRI